jgi:hypothetical protein
MAMTVKIVVFRAVMLYSLEGKQTLGGTCCLHLQNCVILV